MVKRECNRLTELIIDDLHTFKSSAKKNENKNYRGAASGLKFFRHPICLEIWPSSVSLHPHSTPLRASCIVLTPPHYHPTIVHTCGCSRIIVFCVQNHIWSSNILPMMPFNKVSVYKSRNAVKLTLARFITNTK